MLRADCHVHLDPIGPPHNVPAPSLEDLLLYTRREAIGLVCGIYEREATLRKFAPTRIRIVPFFWEHTPQAARIPASAKGLKLHPYLDGYVLKKNNILSALRIAQQRKLPVLIHTDDRKPSLSRGRLVAALAREFPELTFIAAHSGAYAPESGAPGKLDAPGQSSIPEARIRELVSEAIDEAARACPNVFLEVSILASRLKAQLIAERAPVEKILLGSDFPIDPQVFGSVVFQENALRAAGMSWEQIETLHRNAFQLFADSAR